MAPQTDYYLAVGTADTFTAIDIYENLMRIKGAGPASLHIGEDGVCHFFLRADHPNSDTTMNIMTIGEFAEIGEGSSIVSMESRRVSENPSENIWDPDEVFKKLEGRKEATAVVLETFQPQSELIKTNDPFEDELWHGFPGIEK